MQLDIYWIYFGGQDPMEYFNKYPGRFGLWHVKDMADTPDKQTTEIGSGIIDFPALFDMADKAGLEYYFVEQESFQMDPIKSVAQSFNYLNSL
jgi:sugar phosphate isomerase/epimerase